MGLIKRPTNNNVSKVELDQTVKLGALASNSQTINIITTPDYKLPKIEVLKLSPGQQNVNQLVNDFRLSDSSSLEYNASYVELNGQARLKSTYVEAMNNDGVLGTGNTFSITFDFNEFDEINGVS